MLYMLFFLSFFIHSSVNYFPNSRTVKVLNTIEYLYAFIVGLIFLLFVVWYSLQFFGSFLTIYTDGVGIVTPYRFKIQKYFPWSSIKGIKMVENDDIYGGRYEYYGAIYFVLKESKHTIKISELWADNLQEAYDLMLRYIKPIKKPEYCKNHPNNISTTFCRSCGAYFCDECIETKEIYSTGLRIYRNGRVYQKCVSCNFNIGLKRMAIIYSIALIIPVAAISLLLFNLILDFGGYLYSEIHGYWYISRLGTQFSFFGNIFGISSTYYTIISIFLFAATPYAFGFNIVNLIKTKKLNRLKINYRKKSLFTLTILAILIIIYYSILYFQFNHVWLIVYLTWIVLLTVFSFIFEYWGIRPPS